MKTKVKFPYIQYFERENAKYGEWVKIEINPISWKKGYYRIVFEYHDGYWRVDTVECDKMGNFYPNPNEPNNFKWMLDNFQKYNINISQIMSDITK